MCMPSIPGPVVSGLLATELGYRPAEAIIKAGEALLDKVVDFDGDKSTLSDAKRELKRAQDNFRFVATSNIPIQDKLMTVALAPILAPIGAIAAPVLHPLFD